MNKNIIPIVALSVLSFSLLSCGDSDADKAAEAAASLAPLSEPVSELKLKHGANSFSIHPDGRTMAVSSENGVMCFYDLSTGQLNSEKQHRDCGNAAMRYSADGKYLVRDGGNDTVLILDATSKAELGKIRQKDFYRFVISPDSKQLACVSMNGEILVSEIPSGKKLREMTLDTGARWVAYSPDSKYLASAGGGKTVIVTDLSTGEALYDKALGDKSGQGYVNQFCYSPKGNYLGVCCGTNVYVLNAKTGDVLIKRYQEFPLGCKLQFSSDDQYLAIGSHSGDLTVLQLSAGSIDPADSSSFVMEVNNGNDGKSEAKRTPSERFLFRKKMLGNINFMQFCYDGRYLAVAVDGECHFLNLAKEKGDAGQAKPNLAVARVLSLENPITSVQFSPDGKSLAVGMRQGKSCILDFATEHCYYNQSQGNKAIYAYFSEDALELVTQTETHEISRNCIKTGALTGQICFEQIKTMKFFPKLNRVIAQNKKGQFYLLDATTGGKCMDIGNNKLSAEILLSEDGQYMATRTGNTNPRLRNAKTGADLPAAFDKFCEVQGFSSDSKYIAYIIANGKLRVLETATGKEISSGTVKSHSRMLVFSPDSKTVFYVNGSTLGFYDVASGTVVYQHKNSRDINSIHLSPSGKFIGIVSHYGGVNVLELSSKKVVSSINGNSFKVFDFSPDESFYAAAGETRNLHLMPLR